MMMTSRTLTRLHFGWDPPLTLPSTSASALTLELPLPTRLKVGSQAMTGFLTQGLKTGSVFLSANLTLPLLPRIRDANGAVSAKGLGPLLTLSASKISLTILHGLHVVLLVSLFATPSRTVPIVCVGRTTIVVLVSAVTMEPVSLRPTPATSVLVTLPTRTVLLLVATWNSPNLPLTEWTFMPPSRNNTKLPKNGRTF